MKFGLKDLSRLVSERPDELRAILVYGPDEGHVRETAETLARSIVDDLDDPFRVSLLHGDSLIQSPGALMDAATARSLTGGSRLVRVRHATDRIAPLLEEISTSRGVESVTVVESGALRPASRLRKLFETADTLGALPCYGDDGSDLRHFIRDTLRASDVQLSDDALGFLAERLGADRQQTRGELEKLALMAGPGHRLELAEVAVAIGDGGALGLDDVANAVGRGDGTALEQALTRAWGAGQSPVRVLRLVLVHFQRLHQTALALTAGRSPESAMAGLQPPVLYMNRRRFAEQARLWPVGRIEAVLGRLDEAERRCKLTGFPGEAVCGQALLGICLAGQQLRRRAGASRR